MTNQPCLRMCSLPQGREGITEDVLKSMPFNTSSKYFETGLILTDVAIKFS